ncbi:MAG: carboxypeptidase-like regulatory domain-containing protein [Bacteroidales bacterium]|nr:carboxypeptidase-like regulatory domain-containing protein [Bacteroidales bacterium]
MKLFLHTALLCTWWITSLTVFGQKNNADLVQFSGVVVTADSLRPVPFTNIYIETTGRGTTSDYWGFFSIVVRKSDIITFSSVGYKKVHFRIPDTLSENRYSLIQVMSSDTIMLTETVIYPWPSRQQFRQAFLKLEIPDDDIEIARKNLAYMEMRDRDPRNYDPEKFGMNGAQNYRNYVDRSVDRLYYAGQTMPNNLLNPIAWAKFIQAWKRGDFKKKY